MVRSGTHAMAKVMKLSQMLVLLLVGLSILICSVEANREDDDTRLVMVMSQMHPPKRPEHFRNMEELNVYLDKLRQYYTILGRPRFGRSLDHILDLSRSSSSLVQQNIEKPIEQMRLP